MRAIVVFVALSLSGCSCQQTGSCDSNESSEASESHASTYSGGCGGPFDEPPVRDLAVQLDLSRPALDLTPADDGGLDDGGLDDGGLDDGGLDDAAAPTD